MPIYINIVAKTAPYESSSFRTELRKRLLHDPSTSQVLFEFLWRGLRHVDLTKGAHGPLSRTVGLGPLRRIQAMSAQQLLEWGRDIALEELSQMPGMPS